MELKTENEKYSFKDLFDIIRFLRSEDGCPWDREQTHESLITPMIEEAFEGVDAINSGDKDKLVEELGDILLQVIFHSIIGEEEGTFSFLDVTDRSSRKMVYRHNHIFGDDEANTAEEVLVNWEERKLKEKKIKSLHEDLDGVPKNFPPLMRAKKFAKKIRTAGIKEEGETFNISSKKELGALLYDIVRYSEEKGYDPYLALQEVLDKKIKEHEKS